MGNFQYVREDANTLNLKWDKYKKSIPISTLEKIEIRTCWNGHNDYYFCTKSGGSDYISIMIDYCGCFGNTVSNGESFMLEIKLFCRKHKIPLTEFFTDWNGKTCKYSHV